MLRITHAVRIYGFLCEEERLFAKDGEGNWYEYSPYCWSFSGCTSSERMLSLVKSSTKVMRYDCKPDELEIRSRSGMAEQYDIMPDIGVLVSKEEALDFITKGVA